MATLYENKERIKAAKQSIKQSIRNKGIEILDELKIENYNEKVDCIINIKNEDQFCYLFKNGRFLEQFDNILSQSKGTILDCTGMFHNICLKDNTTYRIFDFQKLNLSECTNFYDCFTGGADWWTIRGKVINFDMSKVDNCSYMFNNCTYLTGFTFKSGASFGGNSNNPSLTIDLSQCKNLSLEAFSETMTTISKNTSGNVRIFKLTNELYNNLTDEIWGLADEKLYDIASA